MVILFTALYLYAFWAIYILVMGLYRAHLNKRLHGLNKWMAQPVVLLGYAMDVFTQFTIATLVFSKLPHLVMGYKSFTLFSRIFLARVPVGDWLVTARLKRYKTEQTGYRQKLAIYICDELLDVFDPTGDHC